MIHEFTTEIGQIYTMTQEEISNLRYKRDIFKKDDKAMILNAHLDTIRFERNNKNSSFL